MIPIPQDARALKPNLLKWPGVSRRKLRLYCLAGNEPIAACEQRVQEINEWGCYPVQRRRPLDYMGGPLPCIHDWTEKLLIDFQRWGNRLGKSMRFADYVPNLRESGRKAGKLFE